MYEADLEARVGSRTGRLLRAASMFGLACVLAAMAFASTASAALISTDYQTSGDGLLTLDTATGFEWLDVSATIGLNRVAILGGAGGWIDEFRYATHAEVLELFTNAGMTVLNTYTAPQAPTAGSLRDLLDTAQATCATPASYACGFYEAGSITGIMNVGIHPSSGQGAFLAYTGYPLDATNSTYGNMLIRTVPEPGTALLLGLGLLGFATRTRRAQKPRCAPIP